MRVSKAVRNYIEKEVAKRFPKTERELQHEQNKDKINQANQEIKEKMAISLTTIMVEVAKKYNITDEIAIRRYDRDYFDTWDCVSHKNANTDRRAREEQINKTIENIIVTLELGGTKADLEKMLAEIK